MKIYYENENLFLKLVDFCSFWECGPYIGLIYLKDFLMDFSFTVLFGLLNGLKSYKFFQWKFTSINILCLEQFDLKIKKKN